MNRSSVRILRRGLVAATTAAIVVCGVPAVAASATGATVPLGVAKAAEVPEWETTEEDKVKAFSVLAQGDPGPELILLNDRDFVFEIWKRSAGAGGEVHATAELTLMANDQAGFVAFIQGGIHAAQARQIANDLVAAEELRAARALRRNAAAAAKIVADERMLLLSEKDFTVEILLHAEGTRVKAAAQAALKGDAGDVHAFLATGVKLAAEQDLQDLLEKIAENDREERERQIRLAAMRSAAAVLGIVASEGMLAMSDQNFVVAIWNAATEGTEVHAAAVTAVRSDDPVVLRAFINTGIHEANKRDIKIALDKKAAADRRILQQIVDDAEKKGLKNLAAAGRKALAGSPDEVADFLRVGQFQVRHEAMDARADVTLVYKHSDGAIAPFTFARDTSGNFHPRSGWKSAAAAYDANRLKVERGDFNGDGAVDQAVLHSGADGGFTLDTFIAKADGSYNAPLRSWTAPKTWGSWDSLRLTSGDYNGDGRTDLAGLYGYSDKGVALLTWTARPDGGFNNPYRSWYAAPQPYWGDPARMKMFSGDFNGDGRADVASFYNYADKGIGLLTFLSTPDGKLSNPFRSWYAAPEPYWGDLARLKIVAGDFDGDKRTDVAGVYNYANGNLALLTFTAKADGGFKAPTASWRSTTTAWGKWERTRLVSGDYNADGKADVAALVGHPDESLSLQTFTAKADGGFNNPTRSWSAGPGVFGSFARIEIAGEYS